MDKAPSNLLSFLSLSDLETLIQTIVRRILRSELQQIQAASTQPTPTDPLLATFGTWEDERPVKTIIEEIYSSRTISPFEA